MSRKKPSGLTDRAGAPPADSDSIDDSLNQILAEADAPPAAAHPEPIVEGDEALTPLGGLSADDMAGLDQESEGSPALADDATPMARAMDDATPMARMMDDAASMSGPSLVDDVKEEPTDVESIEALAAAAAEAAAADGAAAEAAAAAPAKVTDREPIVPSSMDDSFGPTPPPPDLAGTPVRDEVAATLAKAIAPPEEIVTATGGAPSRDEVITAQNVGAYTPPKEARRPEASTAPLSDQARDERERALRRSQPPSLAPGGPDDEAELEMSDLSYEKEESASESSSSYSDGNDTASLAPRRSGGEPWPASARGSDSGPVRTTPPPFSAAGSGSGRHMLPPPLTPSPGSPTRMRMPTPKPGTGPSAATPSPRITGSSIPVAVPSGTSGPSQAVRTTSAVFSKVQLPLGGLVTVVGAAFGVGLIIGALVWRGTADSSSEPTAHAGSESKAAAPAPAETPAPAAPSAPAPVVAAPAAPAATAVPPTPPPAATPPPSPVAVEPPAAAQPVAASEGTATAAPANKKTMAAASKTVRPKRTGAATGGPAPGGKGDVSGGKTKAATWVDPFAQ